MIPKETKYNLHYDDVRGDFLLTPYGTTPIYVEWTLLPQLFGLVCFQQQGVWWVFIFIVFYRKLLYIMQTMQNQIRRRILRRLIWICIVCQLPFCGDSRLKWYTDYGK